MSSRSSQDAYDSGYGVEPFKIPSTYPPCILAANELEPIVMSQMKPESHHRGKATVIHVFTPPIRNMAAVAATFMDEEGKVALLQLYNQPSDTIVPAEQALRHGRCYLIKEPFFMVATNGCYSLRVDHPSDILILPHDHELIPPKWRKNEAVIGGSHDMRMKGNTAVSKKRWAEAEILYSTAARIAETAEERQLAYVNRSLVNLRLGRPATALADAIKSYEGDSLARTEKALFREASALYALAKYDQCLDKLQTLVTAYPTSISAMPMIKRVQARLQEQQSGQYDFRRMYKQAKATPPLIDCATYNMPVEIRNSPGKGRGVFTMRKVLAGELLICEKAFGYVYGGKDHPDSRNKTEVETYTDLRAQIVQKLFDSVEDARLFNDLHHGDYDAVSVDEVDGKPVVDACLVGKVISLTNYRAPRTSLSSNAVTVSGDVKCTETQISTTGLWSFISHINHSCISNSRRSFIGDMQIVRATRDLEAGAEVYAWYHELSTLQSYDQAQESLSQWGFTCDCALCLDKKVTTGELLIKKRVSLLAELARSMDGKSRTLYLHKAEQTLDRLTETYSAAAQEPGGVRLELWAPCFAIGETLNTLGMSSEAIAMILRGLESLGFVISANPPRGVAKSSKPELRIKQWGLADVYCLGAFRILHEAYKTISPESSKVAREYMEVTYRMVMGESDTFLDTYPDLG